MVDRFYAIDGCPVLVEADAHVLGDLVWRRFTVHALSNFLGRLLNAASQLAATPGKGVLGAQRVVHRSANAILCVSRT